MAILTAEQIAKALGKATFHQTYWLTNCPAHDDRQASLSVADGKDHPIIFKCHAGCTQQQIIDELKSRGLWGMETERPNRRIVSEYDYKDENGAVLFQSVRYEPKDFRQRRLEGREWVWNVRGVRLVPYHLPEILDRSEDRPIWIVEGEKDADRLCCLNQVATTSPMGAGKWRQDYNQYFKGADVFIVPDNDEPGIKHADSIKASLTGIAKCIKIVKLPTGKDVSDWIDQGGTVEQLQKMADVAPNGVDGPTLLQIPFRKGKRLDFSTLDSVPIPERKFIITDWGGVGWPIALTGHGGKGKSTIAQTAITCVGDGIDFFGNQVEQRNSMIISGDESLTDLHIRQHAINKYYGRTYAELHNKVHIWSFLEDDITCFTINSKGIVEVTDMWWTFRDMINEANAGFVFLDHWGLMVAGTEGDRHATGVILKAFRTLAEEINGVVLFSQHPSKGANSEYSGNTGFEGGIKCRWTMDSVANEENEPKKRVLRIGKANYADETSIDLEWRYGLFLPTKDKLLSKVEIIERDARVNTAKVVFMEELKRLTLQQRAVSEKIGKNYAPTVINRTEAGGKFSVKELARAMNALFESGALMANVELPWKKADRHQALGLAMREG